MACLPRLTGRYSGHMSRERTGAERYFAERMDDPEYRCTVEQARHRDDQFDSIIRLIDQRRNELGWSYEELACQANINPEDIRQIYSLETPDPSFGTVVDLACAVGLELGAGHGTGAELGAAKIS